jgi:hypothetical protein
MSARVRIGLPRGADENNVRRREELDSMLEAIARSIAAGELPADDAWAAAGLRATYVVADLPRRPHRECLGDAGICVGLRARRVIACRSTKGDTSGLRVRNRRNRRAVFDLNHRGGGFSTRYLKN